MADLPTKCPKCGGELVDGTCLFDGPLSEILATLRQAPAVVAHPDTGEVAQKKVHKGWTGYDRDLGAKKRQELAAEAVAVEERSKLPGRIVAALGTALSLAVAGAVLFLWNSGGLERLGPAPVADTAPATLPRRLAQPASPSREELALFARALDELAIEAEARLVGDSDPSPAAVERFAARLDGLHDSTRALESKLTREETRVLMALQQAERDMAQWFAALRSATPELSPARLQNARANVERALTLVRGGELESPVKAYAEKMSPAQQLQQVELDPK